MNEKKRFSFFLKGGCFVVILLVKEALTHFLKKKQMPNKQNLKLNYYNKWIKMYLLLF